MAIHVYLTFGDRYHCRGCGHFMPKTKGRKSGIGQTNSLRQTATSSLQRRRTTTASIDSLRRSTRIVVANNNRIASPPVFQMADVARRQQSSSTRSRSVEAEIERQLSRRRTRVRADFEPSRRRVASRQNHTPTRRINDVEPELNGYILEFIVGPPSQIATDSPIGPAVTLQVRIVPPGPTLPPSDRSLHQYIAVATLVAPDGNGTLVAVAPGTLGGPHMADSVRAPGITNSSDVLGYVSFPDLHVRYSGTYRIRVSLMRIGSANGSGHGGMTLQTADSGFINVFDTE